MTYHRDMPNHGGARPGAGRKPRASEAATVDVHLRLTPTEHDELTVRADAEGKPLGASIRDAALRAARNVERLYGIELNNDRATKRKPRKPSATPRTGRAMSRADRRNRQIAEAEARRLSRRDDHGRTPTFYVRLGRLMGEPAMANVYMSRAIQIAGTWRSHLAWRLALALGWPVSR